MAFLEYILALDYGEKRVGVAIAHEVARMPRPLTTLTNDDGLMAEIAKLVNDEAIKMIVVGLPRSMDGGYSAQTRIAEAFAKELEQSVTVPVVLVDETLTSVDAEATLGPGRHPKGAVDAIAATYILERYLHEHAGER